jgi:hypothetical protein
VVLLLVHAAIRLMKSVDPRHSRASFFEAGCSRRRQPGGTEN